MYVPIRDRRALFCGICEGMNTDVPAAQTHRCLSRQLTHSVTYLCVVLQQLGHAGEKKGEEEPSEDFTRRDKHHFDLRDLEVMETLGR